MEAPAANTGWSRRDRELRSPRFAMRRQRPCCQPRISSQHQRMPHPQTPRSTGTLRSRHTDTGRQATLTGSAPHSLHGSTPDHRGDFFHDPGRNPFSNFSDSWLQVCNFTSHPGWNVGGTGWTGTQNSCMHQFVFNAAPGIDLGNPPVGPGGWSLHAGYNVTSMVNSPGISIALGASQIKSGIGDNVGSYVYNFSYGGAVAQSDEGNHLQAALGGEQTTVYAGSITKGGRGRNFSQSPVHRRLSKSGRWPVSCGHPAACRNGLRHRQNKSRRNAYSRNFHYRCERDSLHGMGNLELPMWSLRSHLKLEPGLRT